MQCPICQKEYRRFKPLLNHLKTGNLIHKKLYEETQNIQTIEDLNNIYNNKKEVINLIEEEKCPMNCQDCFNNWKDEFEQCNYFKKQAFLKEVGMDFKEDKIVIDDSVNLSSDYFYNYYYREAGSNGNNFIIEKRILKSSIEKDGYSIEEMRYILDYMLKRGKPLKNFNYFKNEALEEMEMYALVDEKYTAPYYVKVFYTKQDLEIDPYMFKSNVSRMQEIMDTYTNEEIVMTLKYMTKKKIAVFNYINSIIPQIKSKMDKMSSNPCFNDRSQIDNIINELKSGRSTIYDFGDEYMAAAKSEAIKIFENSLFDIDNFNHFEWAWKVKLDLDANLLDIAVKNTKEDKYINIISKNPRYANKINRIKNSFIEWKNQQMNRSGKYVI